jgi:ABC-2 type transport system permease protein
MSSRVLAVSGRIARQLRGDKRFLGLALGVPLLVVYILRAFMDALPPSARVFADLDHLGLLITAFIVHFTAYVRERREQTLTRMFVNNFRPVEVIGGYLVGYAVLATVQAALVMGEVCLLFRLSYPPGTVAAIFAVYWLLALISIALGMLVSNLARTEAQIFPFVPLFMLPSVLLSGLVIPVAGLPWGVRWIAHVTPFTYALDVLKPLVGQGVALPDYLAGMAVLAACGAVLLALAGLTLRERD